MPHIAYVVEKSQKDALPSSDVDRACVWVCNGLGEAPELDAGVIYSFAELAWRNFAYLVSLRAANPRARIVNMAPRSGTTVAARLLSALFDVHETTALA